MFTPFYCWLYVLLRQFLVITETYRPISVLPSVELLYSAQSLFNQLINSGAFPDQGDPCMEFSITVILMHVEIYPI